MQPLEKRNKKISAAKSAAYCAVACALLIAGQVALGFIAGVEIVTVLLLCFSVKLGVRRGVIIAVAFSLLRCFIWGFYPTVIVLYIIYYPLFALIFGCLGKIEDDYMRSAPISVCVTVNAVSICVATVAAYLALGNIIKISRVYLITFKTLLWVIFGLCAAAFVMFNILYIAVRRGKADGKYIRLFLFTAIASVCTICFSLLDDVISPLMLGMTADGALAYFYASFTAMLPQTVCTIVTVFTLYYPITLAMEKAVKL